VTGSEVAEGGRYNHSLSWRGFGIPYTIVFEAQLRIGGSAASETPWLAFRCRTSDKTTVSQ
jgi:hypothetical protein